MKARHIVIMIVAAMVGGGITNWLLQEQRAYAVSDSTSESVIAKEFRLVDSNGVTKAILTTTNDNPGLVLFDSKGEMRLMLHINEKKSDSRLRFFDDNSKEVLNVGITRNRNKSLSILDADGKQCVMLGMQTLKGEATPTLMMSKADNNTIYYVKNDGVRFDMNVAGDKMLQIGALKQGSGVYLGTGDTQKRMVWASP